MNIVSLYGRLGNQMFEYALYCAFKAQGKRVKMDKYTWTGEDKRIEIEECFNLKIDSISKKQHEKLNTISSKNLKQQFVSFLATGVRGFVCDNEEYDDSVLKHYNAYFKGYWQSEKYFDDNKVKQKLHQDFEIPKNFIKNESYKLYESAINSSTSVSLHIRRTDYLNVPELYGSICTDKYYQGAIDYIHKYEKSPRFFVFSDDKEYAIEKYGHYDDFIVVNEDNSLKDIDEFFLMKQCKHNIMANSSFSWWASWLNEYPLAMKLAPNKWLNNKDYEQIYTPDMIRIQI